MEVTTVSPSPASPTEGDDLCEIDVTKVAVHSVTLLISLCGLAGNGAVLGLLRLDFHNADIFYLAFADFLFLLFTVPSTLIFLVEDVSCSPIMPLLYFSFLFQLSVLSCYWALFWLMRISSVMKMFELCCCYDLPLCLSWLVYCVQYWAFFVLFTVIPAVKNLCQSHHQEHCRAALISMYAVIPLLCAGPVLISSTIKFFKAQRDSRRRDTIIFLILLFIRLLSLCNFLQDLGYIPLSSQAVFLLNCIHSSIKPFLYFLAGRCWSPCALSSLQLSLQSLFDEQEEKAAHINDSPMDTRV